MKISNIFKSSILGVSGLLTSLVLFAQDKGLDVDIDIKKEPTWYMQPWVWIVGGAVFILLLIGMLKGNKSS
ncbi:MULTISPECIES: hypothetical protein [unclassified Flavihumibacter]|uniref:hypothetical protein n=1 Tax=unclassified Flavihumibacter TaxID=2621068 RepID=UPI00058078F3|nr:hypothetical protein [Flavihumibacter sp. ZG627]KIC90058.1 hypothetical protein HY58_13740 [Flavihumibacter sp. ZG627]MCG7858319.1 hypothetical protein [Flavihumibacter sediminis]